MNIKFLKFIHKLFHLIIIVFCITLELKASITDSIDVLNYNLNIDLSQFKSQKLYGEAIIKCQPTKNYKVSKIKFMLLKLKVDSVFYKDSLIGNFIKVNFEHNDTIISINKSLNYKAEVKIYYHGNPVKDQSWGGFYFSGEYAFNLGVAFTSNPHNYGRVWFPCIDNFLDKAIYKYSVKVPRGYSAACGGEFVDTLQMPDNSTLWNWEHKIPINTYLASVAVAPYKFIRYDIFGKSTTIPVMLAALANDTAKLKTSFKNLAKAVEIFENYYGKFRFERVGYSLVPFNSGAMEHSCNIAYPVSAADGSLNFETLMTHELSHNWWGNNTTCMNASDMWLNEGWASYSEALFTEIVYGKQAYKNYIDKLHKEVLQFTHLKDGVPTAISNVSHQNTYGSHVYKKGADIVHSIRSAMSDENFKNACQTFMELYKYSNVNTENFINHFSKYGIQANFLRQMITDTGFCHFTTYNYTIENKNNLWEINLNYKSRNRFGNHNYDSIPCEIYVFDKKFKKEVFNVLLGKQQNLKINSNLKPEFICFDLEGKLSDAISDDLLITETSGTHSFENAMINLNITENNDSTLIRVEHHWNYPDEYFLNIPDIIISKERFWKVDGIFSPSFKAKATINYDGSKLTSYTSGWLDNKLLQNQSEDSLVLLYRPNAVSYWQIENNIVKNTGGKTDKKGNFIINELKKGEYTFGLKGKNPSSGFNQPLRSKKIKVYPNPVDQTLTIECENTISNTELEIFDSYGKSVYKTKISDTKNQSKIDTCNFAPGNYHISVVSDNYKLLSQSFIIIR
ncbi:MAG: T9SS type A sorting domain-containing protein [Bacteroidia bacterium]|nr:T9SS type A sorting domain-containing protein [Bacteroidia bacterium]